MRRGAKLMLLALACAGAAWYFRGRAPVHHAPGVLVRGEPEQIMFATPQPAVEKDGWTLMPLAHFTIKARVLGTKRYRNDATAKLAPYDLALGWGRMSDEAVLERLDISQSNRYYRWQYWGDSPIPGKEIITHSANMHVITADEAVLKKTAALRTGALVRMTGWLVEAVHPQADKPWRSSLSRDDDGEGACEIFYVKSVEEWRQ